MAWWEEIFDEYFEQTQFHEQRIAQTSREVDFIEDVLGLRKSDRILDLCCGIGRHTVELARRGYAVTGVDLTQRFIQKAQKEAKRLSVHPTLLIQDMRRIDFREAFDACINIWTSFGFFPDPEDNQRVLQNVAQALKPGGRFLIDIVNRDYLVRHFQPHRWDKVGDCYRIEDAHFELAESTVSSTWTYIQGEKRAERRMQITVYSLHTLRAMLNRAGLNVIQTYGALDQSPLTWDSLFMKIVSEKTA